MYVYSQFPKTPAFIIEMGDKISTTNTMTAVDYLSFQPLFLPSTHDTDSRDVMLHNLQKNVLGPHLVTKTALPTVTQ